MKFTTFCENRYQELVFKIRGSEYDSHLDAQTKSVHDLLTFYRWVLKWLFMPKILFDFLSINLHLKKAPEPVLMNQIADDKRKEDELKKSADPTQETLVSQTRTSGV